MIIKFTKKNTRKKTVRKPTKLHTKLHKYFMSNYNLMIKEYKWWINFTDDISKIVNLNFGNKIIFSEIFSILHPFCFSFYLN